ncbi:MAG: SDR family NAD(P)-dependent oxidoreductase [Parasphingopyxis sp.]|uniref:SDR family NAD(P)-dependent oxidoreductase n=1 Tax=Parasphingopyxis sp. TaxID=1920299 RepID=UPI003F9FA448
MPHMLIFGLGYTAGRLAERLRSESWTVSATRREAGPDAMAFDDGDAVTAAIRSASHILSSVPPADGGDPVLAAYGAALADVSARWIGYLSSTGVYGDTDGAWVDETAPIGGGWRKARADADAAWQALRDDVRTFRLPGIYGPGRSVLDRIRSGKARRIDVPGQVFSRVHVEDIVSGVIAGFDGPAGAYNLADDRPAPHNDVVKYGCRLLGVEPPPLQTMDEAGLSEMARGFYAENRRVANGKAKRLLGWIPAYPDYRAGLRAIASG